MRWFCATDKIYSLRTIRLLSLLSPDCLQSCGKFLELMLRELHGICSLHYLMNIVPQTAGRLLRRAEDPAQFQGSTKWHYNKSLSETFGLPLPDKFCQFPSTATAVCKMSQQPACVNWNCTISLPLGKNLST